MASASLMVKKAKEKEAEKESARALQLAMHIVQDLQEYQNAKIPLVPTLYLEEHGNAGERNP